jgi:hypothetical protein
MINLHVLDNDIKINILTNLSIRDMSHVFRVNKNLLNSHKDILPSLQKVIEIRVNTLVKTLLAQLVKDKRFNEIIRIKNIHPSQWDSEFDVYFADDLKYTLKQPPSSLQDIQVSANNWIFNKIIIKIPLSSGDIKWQLFRLCQVIIEKKTVDIIEVDEKEDPMQVDEGDASSSSSSPSTSSPSENIELRAPEKRLTRQDYIRLICEWITEESREEKNKCFYRILKEIHNSNLSFAALMECLKSAANEISQAEQIDKHIVALFQSLLSYGQCEAINTHLYSQNKNVICEFFAQCVNKYPEHLRLLLIMFPTPNLVVKELKRCGFLLLMKSYIKNKDDTRALDLAKYDMYNTLCKYIIDLFFTACRSKMERLVFCCQLLVRYPKALLSQQNEGIFKRCVSEAILEYGFRTVEEVIPQQLKDKFVKLTQAELMQLQSSYETNRQKLFFQLMGE